MFHQKTAFEPAYEVSACACIIRDSQDNCELLEVKVLESYLSNIRTYAYPEVHMYKKLRETRAAPVAIQEILERNMYR